MRVLLVTGSFPPMTCGVGDYTHALALALAECEGVQVAVLTSTEVGPAAAHPGIEIFPLMNGWFGAEYGSVRDLIGRWKPDVVHIQFPTQGYRGDLVFRLPLLLVLAGVRVVQTWHEYLPRGSFPRWQQIVQAIGPGDVVVVRPDYRRNMPRWARVLTAHRRFHLIPSAPTIPRMVLDDAARRAIRARYAPPGKSLLAYFGFLYEHKGVDDLLAIMNPSDQHLVLVGEPRESDPYQRALLERIARPPWAGSVTAVGFLPPDEAARVLAAADAVVLPFRQGGGDWNTSIQAAMLQGTFVLTTSTTQHGYDAGDNVYYARPADIEDLRRGLGQHLGVRSTGAAARGDRPTWPDLARRHLELYARRR